MNSTRKNCAADFDRSEESGLIRQNHHEHVYNLSDLSRQMKVASGVELPHG
jgi:hypothetical protein